MSIKDSKKKKWESDKVIGNGVQAKHRNMLREAFK